MTFGSLLGVLGTLALVLGLMALALRLLRRFAAGTASGRGRLPLEVVQRLALGPKQGIAVVRIGERVLAVSMGEGGIRPLVELDAAERALLAAPAPAAPLAQAVGLAGAREALGALGRAAMGRAEPSPAVPTGAATDAGVMPERRTAAERRTALLSPLPPVAAVSAEAPAPVAASAVATEPATTTAGSFATALRTALGAGVTALLPLVAALALGSSAAGAQGTPQPSASDVPAIDVSAITQQLQQSTLAARGTMGAAARNARVAQRATAQAPVTLARATQAPVTQAPATRARATQAPATRGALRPPVAVSGQPPRRTPPPPPAARPQPAAQPSPGVEPPALARVDTMVGRLAPQMDLRVGGGSENGGLRLSGTVGIVVMMGLLTLLPTLLLMMTGFTRILIVLHFLRQAMGTQSAPPAHLVAALALLLTGFVMAPTMREVNEAALQPWLDGRMEQAEMLKVGAGPFREFMVRQTRESDIRAFLDMSEGPEPATMDDVPLVVLTSAFVVSELRTAFQIGFALFLPFIVIDVVVSSVLMSMGMFMLPPAMISLPFKLLLFVLVDGWSLLVQSLVQSFR